MKVYRLVKAQYAPDWSGKGAEMIGRRWNSKGTPMIYTSESRALCTAEIAVHLDLGIIATGYQMNTIFIPDPIIFKEVLETDLPKGWKTFPFISVTQSLGDLFIHENMNAVMKVPSAVVPGDFNYLLNPRHPDFGRIEIIKTEPYEFDERFFKR
jgi:RES domain-containing protein